MYFGLELKPAEGNAPFEDVVAVRVVLTELVMFSVELLVLLASLGRPSAIAAFKTSKAIA